MTRILILNSENGPGMEKTSKKLPEDLSYSPTSGEKCRQQADLKVSL